MSICEEIASILENDCQVKFGNKGVRVFEDGNMNPPYTSYAVTSVLDNSFNKEAILNYFKEIKLRHGDAEVIYWRYDKKVTAEYNQDEDKLRFRTRLCYLPIKIDYED